MRSHVYNSMPASVRKALVKLGGDIAVARKKRVMTIHMLAERVNVAPATIKRVEKGDPDVRLGVYAMTLFVLGFGDRISTLVDPARDDTGMLLDEERLPERVRPPKKPRAL